MQALNFFSFDVYSKALSSWTSDGSTRFIAGALAGERQQQQQQQGMMEGRLGGQGRRGGVCVGWVRGGAAAAAVDA
jgi:hypothetical protein